MRVQRTRVLLPAVARRSPLTRHPLGRRSSSFALAILCLVATGTVVGQAPAIPAVQGVTLGTLKARVLALLGSPTKSRVGKDTEMGMGDLLDFSYPGMAVEMCKPDRDATGARAREFHVWRLVVTDKKWRVSPGLRIGMTRPQVERSLGKPESVEQDGGTEVLHFGPFKHYDAFVWVKFKDGYAVEIGAEEDWT